MAHQFSINFSKQGSLESATTLASVHFLTKNEHTVGCKKTSKRQNKLANEPLTAHTALYCWEVILIKSHFACMNTTLKHRNAPLIHLPGERPNMKFTKINNFHCFPCWSWCQWEAHAPLPWTDGMLSYSWSVSGYFCFAVALLLDKAMATVFQLCSSLFSLTFAVLLNTTKAHLETNNTGSSQQMLQHFWEEDSWW